MKIRNLQTAVWVFGITASLTILDAVADNVLDPHTTVARLLYAFRWLTAAIAVVISLWFIRSLRKETLTNTPDRYALMADIERNLSRRGKFSIVWIAVERFTLMNNTLGHERGDRILQGVLQTLLKLAPPDASVYRAGSRSFALILKDEYDDSVLRELFEALKSTLRLPSWHTSTELGVQFDLSCGYVRSSQGKDAHDLLRKCSVAVTVSAATKTLVPYSKQIDTFSLEGLTLATGLRYAVEANQIELVYQPKVDLRTKTVVSVELLSRWNHPEFGMLSPDKFVPYAEQAGTISYLTHFAISRGLKQLAAWRQNGIRISMAVNISAACLDADLIPFVLTEMTRYPELSPADLIFELTETSIMANPEIASRILVCLSLMGHKISIDDFGTGHSSMLYLRNMPISEIKLDKVFVADMRSNALDKKIVEYTISLGHELGCSIVAEGIEDIETAETLLSLNCDIGQGYLFSKPLPASKLTKEYLEHVGHAF